MKLDRRTFLQLLGFAPALPLAARLSALPDSRSWRYPNTLRSQLDLHNRVVNLGGEKLAIGYLGEASYHMMRHRRLISPDAMPDAGQHIIDLAMGRDLRRAFLTAMDAFYRDYYGSVMLGEDRNLYWKQFTRIPPIDREIPCTVCDYPHAGVQFAAFELLPADSTEILIIDWSDLATDFRSPPNIEVGHPQAHLLIENIGGIAPF